MTKFVWRIALIAAASAAALTAAPAWADAELAKAKYCLACHATDKKVIGPAYKDIAARYAGQGGAAARLTERIMKGTDATGGTVWSGASDPKGVPMPANPQVSSDEAKKLAAWVLSIK